MAEYERRSGQERRSEWCNGQCPHIHDLKEDHREDLERQERQNGKDKGVHEREHEVMWKSLDGKLPRWVFGLFFVLAIAVVGGGFGFFGVELRNQRVDNSAVMEKFSTSLISMDKSLAVMSGKISNLEQHQLQPQGGRQ